MSSTSKSKARANTPEPSEVAEPSNVNVVQPINGEPSNDSEMS
jgi:hypothetical protein